MSDTPEDSLEQEPDLEQEDDYEESEDDYEAPEYDDLVDQEEQSQPEPDFVDKTTKFSISSVKLKSTQPASPMPELEPNEDGFPQVGDLVTVIKPVFPDGSPNGAAQRQMKEPEYGVVTMVSSNENGCGVQFPSGQGLRLHKLAIRPLEQQQSNDLPAETLKTLHKKISYKVFTDPNDQTARDIKSKLDKYAASFLSPDDT